MPELAHSSMNSNLTLDVLLVRPQFLSELGVGHDVATGKQQCLEHLQRLLLQRHQVAVAGQRTSSAVQAEIVECQEPLASRVREPFGTAHESVLSEVVNETFAAGPVVIPTRKPPRRNRALELTLDALAQLGGQMGLETARLMDAPSTQRFEPGTVRQHPARVEHHRQPLSARSAIV